MRSIHLLIAFSFESSFERVLYIAVLRIPFFYHSQIQSLKFVVSRKTKTILHFESAKLYE